MLNKKIAIFSVLLGLAACGCSPKLYGDNKPIIRTVHGSQYELYEDKLVQITHDADTTAKLGVISDPHGCYEHVKIFADYFSKQAVDAIVLLGDLAQHSRKKPHPELSDSDEIVKCITEAAKTGLPVYVIPGNHELKQDYYAALAQFANTANVFDLSKIRAVDGDDYDLVSNPYGTDFGYSSDGFLGTQLQKISGYIKLLQKDSDPEILVTHQPPKSIGKSGIDVVYGGSNVGDAALDKIMKENNIKFSLSGHIHEAGGRAVNSLGVPIPQEVFSEDLRLNPGAGSPWGYLNGKNYAGMAGILTIDKNKAKYRIIALE
jgi:Icc-related predicted phosphoesterase